VRKIPSAWVTAQAHLSKSKPEISIRPTDVSHIWAGDVSISHILAMSLKTTPAVRSRVTGTTLLALRRKGIKLIRHIGQWVIGPDARWTFMQTVPLAMAGWTRATRDALDATIHRLKLISPTSLVSGDPELLIPRRTRQLQAELFIKHLATAQNLPRSPTDKPNVWASDGSMIIKPKAHDGSRTVTAAVTGPQTLVMKLPEQSHSILHGEVTALIATLILAGGHAGHHTVYTDHLNTVRLVDDSRSGICQESRIRKRNGRSHYRWLLELVKRGTCELKYTKGHAGGESVASKLNEEADHYATEAQRHYTCVPRAPSSSFMMDPYTLYQDGTGWIESNARAHVEASLTLTSRQNLAFRHGHRMATWLYDRTSPPEYPYLRAYSAYSALVQLYARSGQLATANVIARRAPQPNHDDRCRFGCLVMETPHHIFVGCPAQDVFRKVAGERVIAKTTDILDRHQGRLGPTQRQAILDAARSLFTDSASIWPLQISQYYLGHVPPLHRIADAPHDCPLDLTRLLAQISREWHLTSIYLAGRIYGALQTKVAKLRHWHRGRP
jgi:hypothetical protein